MTQKTYLAASVISIRVNLPNSISAYVRFAPLVGGGSKFVTTDETLQSALEASANFGRLFTLDSTASVSNAITEPKVTRSIIQGSGNPDVKFWGTYNSLSELQAVIGADANDYAWVTSTDAQGNTIYEHYRYVVGTGWVYEYSISNPSFSAAEWAAIQSGITTTLVTKLENDYTKAEIDAMIGDIETLLANI